MSTEKKQVKGNKKQNAAREKGKPSTQRKSENRNTRRKSNVAKKPSMRRNRREARNPKEQKGVTVGWISRANDYVPRPPTCRTYADPTADRALRRLAWEERQRKREEKSKNPQSRKKNKGDKNA